MCGGAGDIPYDKRKIKKEKKRKERILLSFELHYYNNMVLLLVNWNGLVCYVRLSEISGAKKVKVLRILEGMGYRYLACHRF